MDVLVDRAKISFILLLSAVKFPLYILVILGKSHYTLFHLVSAVQPRMLVTFDSDLQPLPVTVRVGQVCLDTMQLLLGH